MQARTVTYFLYERMAYLPRSQDTTSTILRIVDRDSVLIGTVWGCVYTTRQDAARILREYRRRRDNPFTYDGEQRQFVSYTKTVTQ